MGKVCHTFTHLARSGSRKAKEVISRQAVGDLEGLLLPDENNFFICCTRSVKITHTLYSSQSHTSINKEFINSKRTRCVTFSQTLYTSSLIYVNNPNESWKRQDPSLRSG